MAAPRSYLPSPLQGRGCCLYHVDLFSGIGGFALGFQRTGKIKTVLGCDNEDFCRRVWERRFPDAAWFTDVRELTGEQIKNVVADAELIGPWFREKVQPRGTLRYELRHSPQKKRERRELEPGVACGSKSISVITAGFPCQDLSVAGKQRGIDAERSGLWSEVARIVGEFRPDYLVLENVPALLAGDNGRWFGRVLGDLASLGFDALWGVISARDVGAHHLRKRVWVIAVPNASSAGPERHRRNEADRQERREGPNGHAAKASAAAGRTRARVSTESLLGRVADGVSRGLARPRFLPEPPIRRVAAGIPDRVSHLKGLGNAIVPQIATIVGNAIIEAEA